MVKGTTIIMSRAHGGLRNLTPPHDHYRGGHRHRRRHPPRTALSPPTASHCPRRRTPRALYDKVRDLRPDRQLASPLDDSVRDPDDTNGGCAPDDDGLFEMEGE